MYHLTSIPAAVLCGCCVGLISRMDELCGVFEVPTHINWLLNLYCKVLIGNTITEISASGDNMIQRRYGQKIKKALCLFWSQINTNIYPSHIINHEMD